MAQVVKVQPFDPQGRDGLRPGRLPVKAAPLSWPSGPGISQARVADCGEVLYARDHESAVFGPARSALLGCPRAGQLAKVIDVQADPPGACRADRLPFAGLAEPTTG